MAKKNPIRTDTVTDCACVIHGSGYDWIYVENLHRMLTRALPGGVRLHVYTEHDRSVPPHMIKHCLQEWPGISGPKRSWWYKMQLFNPEHHPGNLLYFDLDTVIVRDIAWITHCHTDYFWGIRDFRYLQRPGFSGLNSSVMWFNVKRFSGLWQDFERQDITAITRRYPGDQDYITAALDVNQLRYFEDRYFQSYRWQCLDGGFDFESRSFKDPGSGVRIAGGTAVVVFHGQPKPHQVESSEIQQLWCG